MLKYEKAPCVIKLNVPNAIVKEQRILFMCHGRSGEEPHRLRIRSYSLERRQSFFEYAVYDKSQQGNPFWRRSVCLARFWVEILTLI